MSLPDAWPAAPDGMPASITARQWRRPARSASAPASPLPRRPALPADTSPPAGPKRSGNARISRSSGSAKTTHPGRSASTGTARAASPTSNAAPLNARTAATARSSPAPSSISSASTTRTSPRRSAPGSPATDGNSNPNRYVPPTAIAPRTDSGSCTKPRHRPTITAAGAADPNKITKTTRIVRLLRRPRHGQSRQATPQRAISPHASFAPEEPRSSRVGFMPHRLREITRLPWVEL